MEEINNFKIPTKLSEKKKSALCSTPCCRYSCLSVYAEAWLCLTGKCLPYEMISKRFISFFLDYDKINSKCTSHYQSMCQKVLTDDTKILKNLHLPNVVGHCAFTEASDGSLRLAMDYRGGKSLNDLIGKQNKDSRGLFPIAIILKVALNIAIRLKYTKKRNCFMEI